MTKFLRRNGFDVTRMSENVGPSSDLYPTCHNIEEKVKALTENATDDTVLYFSGHGGPGELVCSDSYKTDKYITTTWLTKNYANKIPKNTTGLAMIDACHSGTTVDLPYKLD